MRALGTTIGLTLASVALAACSSSTAPNSGGGGGGGGSGGASSNTITASSQTSGGGAYGSGSGGNYYFTPTPDTIKAGTQITYMFGAVTHNVHFDAVANAPDSIPSSTNTTVGRTFTTAGTYNYHCTIHNFAGVVVVQ